MIDQKPFFRELKKSDVDLVLELYQSDFADGWSKEQLKSAFNTGRFIALGAFYDKLIGVITLSVSFEDADVEGVVVKREFRKNGVATKLFDLAEKTVKEKGVSRLLLEVREGNIPAVSFYQKQGFNKISIRKNYYSDGENALVMVKEI